MGTATQPSVLVEMTETTSPFVNTQGRPRTRSALGFPKKLSEAYKWGPHNAD